MAERATHVRTAGGSTAIVYDLVLVTGDRVILDYARDLPALAVVNATR